MTHKKSMDRRDILRTGIRLAALTALAGPASSALAAMFTDRPIKLIVPFPAGGAADLMARGLAQQLEIELKQQIIIDNRGGAGGAPAAESAAHATPDGTTLFFGTMGTHAINTSLHPKLRYDPIRDFAPVALTHTTPRVLVVGPSIKAATVAEIIKEARAQPAKFSYGSAGSGSSSHLSGALFEALAGVEMLHVPYKGSAPLVYDVLAGRVDMTFDSYAVYQKHIESGAVRALAVTSRTRIGVAPHLPTLAESGLKGYEVSNWLGVFAPAGTPQAVIKELNTAIGKAMAAPALRKRLVEVGIEPAFSTPEELGELVRTEIPKWAAIVKRTNAKAE